MNDVAITTAGLMKHRSWFAVCRSFILKIMEKLDIDNWEVSILFCDDPFIAELNRRYRGVEGPTDVLSFSQAEAENSQLRPGAVIELAGDIIISLETLKRNAETASVSDNEELKRLLIHGLLHLMGMDHDEEPSDMLIKQEKLLSDFKKEKIV